MDKTKLLKIFAVLFLVFSFAGFLDASYLSAKHYLGSPVTCGLLGGCETVTSSQYSKVLGIPVALLGSFYYLSVLVMVIWYFDRRNQKTLDFVSQYVFVGMAASLYFVFLQAFIIKSWCLYCLGSAVSSTALFVVGLVYMKYWKHSNVEPLPPAETLS